LTLIGRNLWMGLEGNRIGTGRILVMDASTGHLEHSIRHLSFPDIIIPGPTAVWASGVNANLWRIDPKTFAVKHLAGYQHLEAITQTSMWMVGKGVERRNSKTDTLLGHSSPLTCTPARVIATSSRAWVTHCVKVGPDPVPEGPPQVAPMLSAYDISQNHLLGPPIPVGELGESQRPLFRFGSIWWLARGLQKVDSSALACQTNTTCAKAKEVRYTRSP
jgi:hypothetical protein